MLLVDMLGMLACYWLLYLEYLNVTGWGTCDEHACSWLIYLTYLHVTRWHTWSTWMFLVAILGMLDGTGWYAWYELECYWLLYWVRTCMWLAAGFRLWEFCWIISLLFSNVAGWYTWDTWMFLAYILEVDLNVSWWYTCGTWPLLPVVLEMVECSWLMSLQCLHVTGRCTGYTACSLALGCAMGALRGGCLMPLQVLWVQLHVWALTFRVWMVLAGFCLA